jgi:hypothetical protein
MSVANVAITDTFDQWRIKTNQLIIANEQTDIITRSSANTTNVSFNAANAASIAANAAFIRANAASITANVSFNVANVAFDRANSANLLAFNTGIGANAFASATIAGANTAVGAGANTVSIAAFGTANAAFIRANAASITANVAFDRANSANLLAFNTGIGANAFTSATVAGANTAVGAGANTVSIAAFGTANVSFNAANASFIRANAASITANASFNAANASFNAANAASITANVSFNAANASFIRANAASITANVSFNAANASFARANASAQLSGATFTGQVIASPGAGQGSVSLIPGTALNPGYIQFNSPDGIRRGYIGWNNGNNLTITSENGWNYTFNQTPLVGNNPVFHAGNLPGRISSTGAEVTNWNDATEPGFYLSNRGLNESVANTPDGAGGTKYWHGYVTRYNTSWIQQVLTNLDGTATTGGDTWRRFRSNGTWLGWHRVNLALWESDARYAALSGATFTGGVTTTGSFGSTWTTSGWTPTLRLNQGNAIQWNLGASPTWGLGQSGDAFYVIRAPDNTTGGAPGYPMYLTNAAAVFQSTTLTVGGNQVWHGGNFNPNTKANITGATFTGSIAATGIELTGGGAGVTVRRRDNSAGASVFYSQDGYTRLFVTGVAGNVGELLALADNGSEHLLNASGTFRQIWHAGNFNPASYAPLSGANFTGNLQIRNTGPVITLRDTNDDTASLHVNDGQFYILGGPPDSAAGAWIQTGGRWPLQIDIGNGFTTIGGGLDAKFINIQGQPVAAASIDWNVLGSTVWGYPINGVSAGIGGGIAGSNLSVGGQTSTGTWRHVGNYNNLATAGPTNQPSLWRRIA